MWIKHQRKLEATTKAQSKTHDEILLVTLDVLGDLSESSEGDQSDRGILVTQSGAKDLEHAVHHLVDKGLPHSVPDGV